MSHDTRVVLERAQVIRLCDYQPSDYLIDRVHLDVQLHPTQTRVTAKLDIRPNPMRPQGGALVLEGEEVILESVMLQGNVLESDAFDLSPTQLILKNPPRRSFQLTLVTLINPTTNTQLMGLYRSGGMYATQCEAEGFRRITYFLDRPDVMAIYTTRIEAEREEAAILLGNGNLIERGTIEGTSRHYALWHDPHPKPCYLFALVGGNLAHVQETYTTLSGHPVSLGIYTQKGKEDRTAYAMDALKRSMRWDEEVFGREYDLDVFNIVAVPDFNMGAMENKGLNIFNDKYVLASPDTATDIDYLHIEAIIAHEYFHNWTGNRITCRDWFQLCLKEGLTVFRDQEFTSDQRSRAVKRISDVRGLRASQFPEDASPLAHPVRPVAYKEINNFYTATVYDKGAEVIRMLKTLIGPDDFRNGMNLYFNRCDGSAATVEDFITCFADVSGLDLSHFFRWYEQAGTPRLVVSGTYDEAAQTYQVDFAQSTKPTPGQPDKQPQLIPIALGLVSESEGDMPLQTVSGGPLRNGVYVLDRAAASITFGQVTSKPALSVLRGFSAPVILETNRSDDDLLILFAHDTDSFNRWEAIQDMSLKLMVRAYHGDYDEARVQVLSSAFKTFITQEAHQDRAFAAHVLNLPSEGDISLHVGHDINPDSIAKSRQWLRSTLAQNLMPTLLALYDSLSESIAFVPDAVSAGRRALRNITLDLIREGDNATGEALAARQLANATNMTERLAALATLSLTQGSVREEAMAQFAKNYAQDALIMDKWFSLQAVVPFEGTLDHVKRLMLHPAFSITNPNRVRALVGAFAVANPTQFHRLDGAGYRFVSELAVDLDKRNPQTASRLLSAFKTWRTLEAPRRMQAQNVLGQLAKNPHLSRDLHDIIERALV
jgi:aminopeptidase N